MSSGLGLGLGSASCQRWLSTGRRTPSRLGRVGVEIQLEVGVGVREGRAGVVSQGQGLGSGLGMTSSWGFVLVRQAHPPVMARRTCPLSRASPPLDQPANPVRGGGQVQGQRAVRVWVGGLGFGQVVSLAHEESRCGATCSFRRRDGVGIQLGVEVGGQGRVRASGVVRSERFSCGWGNQLTTLAARAWEADKVQSEPAIQH